jgi:capsular polysaccharide biosynthesis protein
MENMNIELLAEKLSRIEEKVDNANSFAGERIKQSDDKEKSEPASEIQIIEFWNILWNGKFQIIGITLAFSLATVMYSLQLPNMYRSTTILSVNTNESPGSLSNIATQYSGLAAMSGLNLGGGESGQAGQAVELIRSWSFLDNLVDTHNLKPYIKAVKQWDRDADNLVFNDELYDAETGEWKTESDKSLEPSSWSTYQTLSGMVTVSFENRTGFLTLSMEHYSPKIAFEWVQLIKDEVNTIIQRRDILDAMNNISFLQQRISETPLTEMQTVFYSLIEDQTKILMLAEVSDEYLVRTVVSPMLPEAKSSPRRMYTSVLGSILGFLVAIFMVFSIHVIRRSKGS